MQPDFRPPRSSAEASETARRLDTIAWAVFFIWVGIAMLVAVPWGWFLLGVGVLILAAQLAHWQADNRLDRFWIACGLVFLAGGTWVLLELPWPLAPILIIMFGLALLATLVDVRRRV